MDLMLLGRVTLVNPLQSPNAYQPMEVRLLGRVTLVNPLQPLNANSPMEVMLLGRVTLVRPLHPSNASSPMEVRLLGRVTLVRPVESENALLPILVTGRLLIVAGISKEPEAFGLEPVMVMVFPSVSYNNSVGVEGLTVRVSDWFPVPVALLALIVMLLIPTVVGVPEMTPVSGLIFKPVGRSVAAKVVVVLCVVMT